MSDCSDGRHYEDLSCCHAAIPYEDVAAITAAIVNARSVLDRLAEGRFVPASEMNLARAGLNAAASALPGEVAPPQHSPTPVRGGDIIICSCGWESSGKGRKVDQVIEYQVHIGARSPEALNQ
jgi:hypothetical protein